MISTFVPPAARFITDKIKDLYKDTSYKQLTSIVCIFLFGKHSVSGAVRDMPCLPSVSTICRGIKGFNSSRLMRRMRRSILRRYQGKLNSQDWAFVIDDTSNPKCGANIFRIGYWGSSSGVFRGQKVLLVALVNLKTHVAIPLEYAILPKRQSKMAPTALSHAVRLMKVILAAGFPPLPTVFDTWFSSVGFIESLEHLGLTCVTQLRANRKVKVNPGPHVRWTSLPEAFLGVARKRTVTTWDTPAIRKRSRKGKCIAKRFMMIRGRSRPLNVVAVYNRRKGASLYGYFASTDSCMSRARIWLLSRARWAIECIFKTCKQFLSFGRLSCQGKEAANLAVSMPFYLLTSLAIEDPRKFGLNRREEISMMLAKIRDGALHATITSLLYRPNQSNLEKLRNRRKAETAHRKPTDKPAGRERNAA